MQNSNSSEILNIDRKFGRGKIEMNKDRGKFLTIMIVLAAFGYLQSLYYLTNTNVVAQVYGTVPSWFPIYTVVGLLLVAVITVGLWLWKKRAIYLLAVSTVVTFLMQLFVLKSVQGGQFVYYMTIISAGLWFWGYTGSGRTLVEVDI